MSKMRDHANKNTMAALQQIEGRGSNDSKLSHNAGNEAPTPVATAERDDGPPPVHVSFSIEKKVGDARLSAYGSAGQEVEAREKIDNAAKHFQK